MMYFLLKTTLLQCYLISWRCSPHFFPYPCYFDYVLCIKYSRCIVFYIITHGFFMIVKWIQERYLEENYPDISRISARWKKNQLRYLSLKIDLKFHICWLYKHTFLSYGPLFYPVLLPINKFSLLASFLASLLDLHVERKFLVAEVALSSVFQIQSTTFLYFLLSAWRPKYLINVLNRSWLPPSIW